MAPPAAVLPHSAAALAWQALATGTDYACQLYLPVNQSLQDTVGINCSVIEASVCVCDDELLSGLHPSWYFITPKINRSMALDAQPGFWYLTDTSGHCAASFDGGKMPSLLACPPGFYCAGHLDPPRSCGSGDHCVGQTAADNRSCPEGFFCPFPASPMQSCLHGAVCKAGSTTPGVCPAGHYCTGGVSRPCPEHFYCPFACAEPVPCSTMKLCPAGSSHEDASIIAAVFLVAVLALLSLGAQHYHRFVQSGFRVCAVLAAMIVLMAAISSDLAGFLGLISIGIATNFALLKTATCPRQVARLLMCVSLLLTLAVLWTLNLAWCMLCSGLLLAVAAGWLMTREGLAFVVAGRSFMVSMFATLLFAYAHSDPVFLLWFGASVLGVATWVTIAFFLEESRVPLPNGGARVHATAAALQDQVGAQRGIPAGAAGILPRAFVQRLRQ